MASFDELLLAAILPHACSMSHRREGVPTSGASYPYHSGVRADQPRRNGSETRLDVDGKRYTEEQFLHFYGAHGSARWAEAKSSSSWTINPETAPAAAAAPAPAAFHERAERAVRWGQGELRVDPADGNLYTQEDFLKFYGNLEAWDRAGVASAADTKTSAAEEDDKAEDGDLMLSDEMLEMLYRQRIRRAKKRSEREQREAEKAFAESSGAVLDTLSTMPLGSFQTKASMLEAEMNGKWDEVLDSVGFEVHAWPIAPLNA